MKIGKDIKPFIQAHTDYEMTSANDCGTENDVNIYTYDDFELGTYHYAENGFEKLTEFSLTTPKYATPEGVKVGMTKAEVKKLIGTDKFDEVVLNGLTYSFYFHSSDKLTEISVSKK